MPVFLNRKGIVSGISKILNEAVSEVIMVVPYIDISDPVYDDLVNCAKRGVEIIVLYRQDKMNANQKQELVSLGNITLLNHPNVHAKCYINEIEMIICSMNLYEYSEKNNREMGVLVDKKTGLDEECYYDAISEVQSIITSCNSIEYKSEYVEKEGFHFKVLTPLYELTASRLAELNKIFEHKKFVLEDSDYDKPLIVCYDFSDDIHVELDFSYSDNNLSIRDIIVNRIEVSLDFSHTDALRVFKNFKRSVNEHSIEDCRIYWNHPKGRITIYRSKDSKWHGLGFVPTMEILKHGIQSLVDKLNDLK